MPKKILQKDSPVLRNKARELSIEEIKSPKTKKIIEEMKIALDSQKDGVAIAAPQIGYSLRIFVVSKRVEKILKKSTKMKSEANQKTESLDNKYVLGSDKVYINPIIKKLSKEKNFLEEGCLSVRYLYGKVRRSKQVSIEARDENGKTIAVGAGGLLAQIFQHEIDHLEGILFIDKAKDIEEIPPEEISKLEIENDK